MALVLLTGGSSFPACGSRRAWRRRGMRLSPRCAAGRTTTGACGPSGWRGWAAAEVIFNHDFHSAEFLDLVAARPWQILAHHGADIAGYREAAYDVVAGIERNAAGAKDILARLPQGASVIVTGTTFEAGEGMSDPHDPALSPYGLSKGLTNQIWRHLAIWQGLQFSKFVIAAPFGPWEEGRFAWSLFQRWMAGEPGLVRTPNYVRDNLPAPLLGLSYARLAAKMLQGGCPDHTARPSGIVGSQSAFARRVAAEASRRLGRLCAVEDAANPSEPEPRERINSEPVHDPLWDEPAFWDSYVDYYAMLASRGLLAATPA